MNKKRNYNIDALRSIAIILIIIYHYTCRFSDLYFIIIEKDLYDFIRIFPVVGVLLFLNISIYLLDSSKNTDIFFSLKNKFRRLWPEYFLCITITYFVTLVIHLEGRSVDFVTFLINITMLEGFIPGISYVDGAHWYITTLLSLSFVITIIKKFPNKALGLLLYQLLCVFLHCVHLGFFSQIMASGFCGCAVLFISLKDLKLYYSNNNKTSKYLVLLNIMISCALIYYLRGWMYLLIDVLCSVIVINLFNKRSMLSSESVALYISKISYPLYLIHQNVSFCLFLWLTQQFGDFYYCYFIVAFIICVLISIVVLGLKKLIFRHIIKVL